MSGDLFLPAELGAVTELLASRCPACGRTEFPRRDECPACGASSYASTLTGPARLRVSTAVLAQPPGSLVEAPYGVGVAEFAEGVCVIGLLDGDPGVGATVVPVVVEPYPDGRMFGFRSV